MGFFDNFSLIGKNLNHLAFVVWEIFEKNLEWVAKILRFLGFCSVVFSSTAAPKNNLIVFK